MRLLVGAAALAWAIATAGGASADEVLDPATLDAVFVVATRDYPDPDQATVRNVHKSLALNGQGYCGEVTGISGEGFTVFHVLLESSIGPSVLRLEDFPDSDQGPSAVTVRQMMRHFGCVE